MPGGIHFLFGLILFYILQWISYFLRKHQAKKTSSAFASRNGDALHDDNNNNCITTTTSSRDVQVVTSASMIMKDNNNVHPRPSHHQKPSSPSSLPSPSLCSSENLKIHEDDHQTKPLTPLLHRIYHRRIDREWFQFGIIVGSVMPDVDLCIAIVSIVFCYLFLGYDGEDNRQVAESVHRTATHSLIICIPLLILFIYMYNKRDHYILNKKKKQSLNLQLSTKNHTMNSNMTTTHIRVTDNCELIRTNALTNDNSTPTLTTSDDDVQASTLSSRLSDENPHLHEHSPSIDDDAPSGLKVKAAAPLNNKNFNFSPQIIGTSSSLEHVSHSHNSNHPSHHHKSKPYSELPLWEKFVRDFKWLNLPFAIGFLVGAIFHIFLDVIYMKGVKLFWPIYGEEIFCEIPWLYLYDNFKYSPMVQKVIMTCDHTSEILFYIAILYYRRRTGKTGSSLSGEHEIEEEAKPAHPNPNHSLFQHHHKRNGNVVVFQKHRTFINLLKHLKNLPHSYTEFIRELWNASEDDWDTIFKYFCLLQIFAIWFTFSLMYFFFPEMGFVQFVIFIYFPGTVCVLISLLAPFCFRETLSTWDWSNLIHGTPKHVDPLSVHLHQGSIAIGKYQHQDLVVTQ
ncbi:hypothetical protein FDP41_012672 [Naegleria fowleri]|uniref:Uncharacterized protein n=1 Tax=Naegleria fowleri TaxID=5763 RepID=A0A6A5C2X5_NAEFO|nr:uncharacterized protein FDP41_012672 [Naegleria fowleri]KAF0980884.1 hypothetical protein FDP41_012672 [Naegleria fowleri]CAG4717209.1 unnamed protein product [Naegleria fowleri]